MAQATKAPPGGAESTQDGLPGPEAGADTPEPAEGQTIAQAILAAQADMPPIAKDATGNYGKFVSLGKVMEAVLPVLHKHGLALIQYPTHVGGEPALETTIWHAATNQHIGTTMLLLAAKRDPQGQGSALTYARRYMLLSMLGLVADEDDDGQSATDSRQREQASDDQEKKLRDRIVPLLVTLDAQTKGERGTWHGLVEDGAVRSFEKKFAELDAPQLTEVGKYLKAQIDAKVSEVPEQIDFSVPF